jgi:F-type H+-transporting ATPase subunit b
VRTRTTLAAGAFALVATFALAGPVAAQEGEGEEFTEEQVEEITHEAEAIAEANGGTEEDGHCIELLIDGESVDDCQEAPSPILPPANELIWGSISFVLLFLALAKFAYPAIKKAMEDRADRIRSDLEAAEGAKAEAEGVLTEYRSQVANAKGEAGRIIEEARQQADAMKREQEQRLQTELAGMRERAAADIESAKTQALADLRNEVAELAIGAAEAVVQRSLDPQTQRQLVDQYIDQLGSRSN